MATTIETALSAVLRERGQRVTPQRLGVARIVGRAERHVTAEQVFDEVGELMPGVSLPTVYATLELLRELGLVERVPTEGGAVVYDPRTDDHHHLVCRRCGAIADVETDVGTAGILDAARA
jgi:Fe2+ or Zn2+ uptake regulation protein